MPAFLCTRCQQMLEIDKPPANTVIPCPTCGTALQPAEEEKEQSQGMLQSALDELIERPGVRMFCTTMSSIVVHVGIGCLIFLIAAASKGNDGDNEKPPEISAGLVADDTPADNSGFQFKGKENKNDREDAPETVKNKIIDKPVGGDTTDDAPQALKQAPNQQGQGASNVAGLTGIGEATSGTNLNGIIGSGASAGSAGGRGGGGSGSGFGNGTRPGGGEVFGVGGLPGAKSIVYVVDRSGSMDQLGDFVKSELSKAVNKLNSTQRFTVIWFSDGDTYKSSNGLVQATEDNKTRLMKHLSDVTFKGSTDPRTAMFEAISLKPDLIYALTDGNFEPEFTDAVTKKNAGKVRINCIGFVVPGGEGHTNLERMAKENKGTFKAIDAIKLTGAN